MYLFRSISAAKAILMMMFSPCQYIASQARLLLSEALRTEGEEHLKQLLHALNFVFSGDISRTPDSCQMLINMVSLTLYTGLPQFSRKIIKYGGVKTLFAFVRWWLDNASHIDKVSLTSLWRITAVDRTCCMIDIEDWDGDELHLMMALWSLAELLNFYKSEGRECDIFAGETTYRKDQFIQDIQKISLDTTSSGVKWYCSYVLSFFSIYGFFDKLGTRVALIREKDHGDMSLVLRDGQSISVHQIILLIRCPSLLPHGGPLNEENLYESNSLSSKVVTNSYQRARRKVTLSAQVDHQALSRLLDFVYSGYLEADEGVVKKLRMLAKYCNIQPLVQLLCRQRPKWGAHVPSFDLTIALGLDGLKFS